MNAVPDDSLQLVAPVTTRHLDSLMALFAQTWWARDREYRRVERTLSTAPVTVGLADQDGQLVAFARAVTDHEFKALVLDVVVDSGRRNEGLGQHVVQALLDHPALSQVDDIELYCEPGLVGYYKRLGFDEPDRTRFLRRTRP